jgi:uncharacterized protein (TIGR00730 family)
MLTTEQAKTITQNGVPPARGNGWGKEPKLPEVKRFLSGPQSRWFEFKRACRIFCEFIYGFRHLHFAGPCVTVFGSARFKEDHPYYGLAREVGGRLAQEGFSVMTGGGPGIMEAANRGAKDVGGVSIGCNIVLPHEQKPNPYLDKFLEFKYFFVRKVMLVKYSYAFIIMPGGLGTLDELFETATLIQTGKIKNFPLVLMGKSFWEPLLSFMRESLIKGKTIDQEDLDKILVTDSPETAVEMVTNHAVTEFGLKYEERPKPRWWLGEIEAQTAQGLKTSEVGHLQ